jgi:hypothetical protein
LHDEYLYKAHVIEKEIVQLDPVNWMAQYLQIITMQGKKSLFRCNTAQLKVHNTLEMQRNAGFPMRAMVLKARREGVSTYVQGRYFMEINTKENRFACVCSADDVASNKVFKMARKFQEYMPKSNRRTTEYSNKKEIVYAEPHNSEFVVQTAGKEVLGRGGLTHYLHCSEYAFWKNAKEQFGGAVQEVPNDPETIVIIESTANGMGGDFYDTYMQSMEDWKYNKNLNAYLPIFLPWFIFDVYRMSTKGIQFETGKPHEHGVELEWVEDEKEFQVKYDLTVEQLMWRRFCIKNNCRGDLSLFKQEYPANPVEAFQSTGRPVFMHGILNHQERIATKEYQYGMFMPEWTPVMRKFDCWKMIHAPVRGHQYVIGVDTMEGLPSVRESPKSELDRHGVMVYDRNDNCFVAMYHGQCDQFLLGNQVCQAAIYYNDALIVPEIPNGMVLLEVLKKRNYSNIYRRETQEETFDPEEGEKLGWRTTTTSRPWLIETFKQAMSERAVKLNFIELIQEMRTMIYDNSGKPTHAPGMHDDIAFGAMLAIQGHVRCPLDHNPYPYSRTDEVNPKTVRHNVDLSRMGAVDPGIEMYSDEDICIFTN